MPTVLRKKKGKHQGKGGARAWMMYHNEMRKTNKNGRSEKKSLIERAALQHALRMRFEQLPAEMKLEYKAQAMKVNREKKRWRRRALREARRQQSGNIGEGTSSRIKA